MAYTALYRKWRPRTFDEVVGQEHITETLKRQIETGRLSHAYLFTGTRGTGKTTCAKILARAVNCEHPVNGNPCNACPSCLGLESGAILDVTEMDAASNNGVENVRALRDEAIYAPTAVKKRVYIVDEVHMLSGPAFNALLKILEEPPEHLMFILATTELHKVPATIISRCQRYAFRRLPADLIASRLMAVASGEGIRLEADAAAALARLADGALRDGISLLDQCSGADDITLERVRDAVGSASGDEIIALYEAAVSGDAGAAVDMAEGLYAGGRDMGSLLEQLSGLYRDLLMEKLGMGGKLAVGGFDADALGRLAAASDRDALLLGAQEISDALSSIDKTPDRRLAAELCIMRLSGLRPQAPAISAPVQSHTEQPAPPRPAAVREPAPQPAAPAPSRPSPEAADASPAVAWSSVVAALKDKLNPGDYCLFTDTEQTSGKIDGTTLTIATKNVFVGMMLEDRQLVDKIKEVFSSFVGSAAAVIVKTVGESDGDAAKNLANLMSKAGDGILEIN